MKPPVEVLPEIPVASEPPVASQPGMIGGFVPSAAEMVRRTMWEIREREKREKTPNLEGRRAHCGMGCGHEEDSSFDLWMFEYLPDEEMDRFYDGCRGCD